MNSQSNIWNKSKLNKSGSLPKMQGEEKEFENPYFQKRSSNRRYKATFFEGSKSEMGM